MEILNRAFKISCMVCEHRLHMQLSWHFEVSSNWALQTWASAPLRRGCEHLLLVRYTTYPATATACSTARSSSCLPVPTPHPFTAPLCCPPAGTWDKWHFISYSPGKMREREELIKIRVFIQSFHSRFKSILKLVSQWPHPTEMNKQEDDKQVSINLRRRNIIPEHN